jgi:hypothetical protein
MAGLFTWWECVRPAFLACQLLPVVPERRRSLLVLAYMCAASRIDAADGYNAGRDPWFSERFGVFREGAKLSPGYAHGVVDKLLKDFAVGTLQRAQTQEIRGLQRGAFGYNEGPTSSCHTFLLEGASPFWTCLFFSPFEHSDTGLLPFTSPSDVSLR